MESAQEEAGVPKGDIAHGFQPPGVRPYAEYAVGLTTPWIATSVAQYFTGM